MPTPREYEQFVAAHFEGLGYSAELTPNTNDYGVDVFAAKDGKRTAIQVKMYGGTARKINREMVMQLHGAKDYFDCAEAIIVTDGVLSTDAYEVATKLGIRVMTLAFDPTVLPVPETLPESAAISLPSSTIATFDDIWQRYVMPLAGKTLDRGDGTTNQVLTVDWSGVKRVTKNGQEGFVKIEVFRLTVARLLERGCILRTEINEEYVGRASSFVVLLLSQVPMFELASGPERLLLRKRI